MPDEKTPLEKILAEYPIEADEVTAWLQHPVTKVFMASVKVEKELSDLEVHTKIGTQDHSDALQANGGLEVCERILEIPQVIIEELKEREKDENT